MKRMAEIVMFSLISLTCSLSIYTMYPIAKRRLFPPKPTQQGELVTGYDFSKHTATLLLILRDGCSHCEANMPFYRKLHPTAKVGVVYAIPGTIENAQAYVENKRLMGEVLALKQLGIKVFGTPTMWLIDAKGKVVRLWTGELNEAKQDEVLSLSLVGL